MNDTEKQEKTVECGMRLFRYESWERNRDGTESFLRCTLKKRFDRYTEGDMIQRITIDFFVGRMTFSEEQRGLQITLDVFDIKYTFMKCT